MAYSRLAVWVITPNGFQLAQKIFHGRQKVDLYVSETVESGAEKDTVFYFSHLAKTVASRFHHYRGHLFIMATGIVVRLIAGHLRNKRQDPAVVVMDDAGSYAISLLSGHLGGANRLAREIAGFLGAEPVITTATDANAKPAIDVIAVDMGLHIDNPAAIKMVNMALLTGNSITLYDPYARITNRLPAAQVIQVDTIPAEGQEPCVRVDDLKEPAGVQTLVLRPQTLSVGIGCNRYTPMAEIKDFLLQVMDRHRLSRNSIAMLASIDVKADEPGLLKLATELGVPLVLYSRSELNMIDNIANPSQMVQKHLGVKSVCEAAAIIAADHGRLIVPKQKTPNVTVAIARKPCPL